MQKFLFILFAVTLMSVSLWGQSGFRLYAEQGAPDRGGLLGNGITDLLWSNGVLYAGTGFGLNITSDDGDSWQNLSPDDYGGSGGISALSVSPDGVVWIATAFDTTIDGDDLQVGGGLRFLEPGSSEWMFIPQPVDARDDTAGGKSPTTTVVQNITFDIAAQDSLIWIASFGGGVRRSLDRGQTWEVVTTDGLPFSAFDHLNHRGFSCVFDTSGNIWVGTVGGISKSADGGQTWERFTYTNQNQPISGNWVIGLFNNPYDNSIWATTLRSTEEDEFNAVSSTANGGLSWTIHLREELSDGTFPRYIAFFDSAVYVATEKGVYKTIDNGQNWFLMPPIRDRVSGEGIYSSTFYSVATSPVAGSSNHRLWVGSLDGLAATANNGFDWTVFRSFVSTRERQDPKVYAYPNPFSPLHGDRPCRFQFDIEQPWPVTVEIYNFAMERVTTLRENYANGGDHAIVWDGKDNNGRLVDNGVYFFRAKVGGEVTWGKIAIIN